MGNANPGEVRSRMVEGAHPVTQARLTDAAGEVLTVSDFTTGSGGVGAYTVFDEQADDPSTPVISTTTMNMAAVISALQTGNGWDKDSIGYNFVHKVTEAAVCAEGGHTYRIEYLFTLDDQAGNDNDVLGLVHRVECVAMGSV